MVCDSGCGCAWRARDLWDADYREFCESTRTSSLVMLRARSRSSAAIRVSKCCGAVVMSLKQGNYNVIDVRPSRTGFEEGTGAFKSIIGRVISKRSRRIDSVSLYL